MLSQKMRKSKSTNSQPLSILEKYVPRLTEMKEKLGGISSFSWEGFGLILKSTKLPLTSKFQFVHYSDPNKLVECLQLLIASWDAGNNGVCDEINTIINELEKKGFLEDL